VADADWLVHVTVNGSSNAIVATCRFNEQSSFYVSGALWDDCPDIAGLWVAFAPTMFSSVAEARPYLPPIPVLVPQPPPTDYAITAVRLPSEPSEAARSPWVVTLVYENSQRETVFIEQQPAGLNARVFLDWATCQSEESLSGMPCYAWAGLGAYVLVRSAEADAQTLHEFEHAIDSRR
jgi:hypothetical protein